MQCHSNLRKNALSGILIEVNGKLGWINYHTTFHIDEATETKLLKHEIFFPLQSIVYLNTQ